MTDGLESARVNADGTPKFNEVYDAAKALFDLVKDKGGNSNGVKTYVIGFGEGFQGNNADAIKNIAEAGGDTIPYFASDLEGLRTAFKKIFQAIGGSYGRSNPVVTRDRGSIYRGYFNLPGWEGHLVAYQLKGDGSMGPQKWDAGDQMKSNGRGKVFTWVQNKKNPDREDFEVGNAATLKDDVNDNPPLDLNWDDVGHVAGDGKFDKKDSETIISFIQDASFGTFNDGKKDIYPYAGTRTPKWKLGDIYHSTPMVVSDPPFNISDGDFGKPYSEYKKNNQGREAVVYIGANDGMLHGIGSDGKEKFAIVPKNLLPGLRDLRNGHQFFVDSSPRAYDIFNYNDNEWRTILISGQRGGGDRYFAIDVTDPKAGDYPKILWQADDADGNVDPKPRKMGNTWSRPEIGRISKNKITGTKDRFVAFVGGGYSNLDDVGNTFYAIDAEDGKILRKFEIGDSKNKVPAGASAFDSDGDGRTDAVYFGDYSGVLWKIAVVGNTELGWKLVKLYDPGADKLPKPNYPVFYPPAVTKNKKGEVLVYFGQGNELDLFEKTNTYYLFEIMDPGTNVDGSGKNNWIAKLDANGGGEKVLASPAVANNVVYFTTWQYTGIESNCGAGVGRIYAFTETNPGVVGGDAAFYLDVDTGAPLSKPQKSFDLGKGIPTAPVVTNKGIYVSSSVDAGKIRFLKIPPWGTNRLKSWREVF